MSASPLRAPWVEMKYWRTSSPSRKFASIGVSMMEPSGFAIRPRIPASWRIWVAEPRAPESAIMKIGLNDGCRTSLPSASRTTLEPIFSIMASATWSLVWDQMSTTLL